MVWEFQQLYQAPHKFISFYQVNNLFTFTLHNVHLWAVTRSQRPIKPEAMALSMASITGRYLRGYSLYRMRNLWHYKSMLIRAIYRKWPYKLMLWKNNWFVTISDVLLDSTCMMIFISQFSCSLIIMGTVTDNKCV